MPRQRGRHRVKDASPAQKAQIIQLHLDVFGYVSAANHAAIDNLTFIRAMQETANLQRMLANKQELARHRETLKQMHKRLFGKHYNQEKFAEIDGYSFERVQAEIHTLARMEAVKAGVME